MIRTFIYIPFVWREIERTQERERKSVTEKENERKKRERFISEDRNDSINYEILKMQLMFAKIIILRHRDYVSLVLLSAGFELNLLRINFSLFSND